MLREQCAAHCAHWRRAITGETFCLCETNFCLFSSTSPSLCPFPCLPPTLCLDSCQSADLLRLQIFCSWRLYARQSAYFDVCVCVRVTSFAELFAEFCGAQITHLCKDDTCPHTCAPLRKDNSSSADTRPADGCWVLWLRGVFVC